MSVLKHSSALGLAGMAEYAAQLLLPVVLVRHLSMVEFGEYRLIWLVANTALAVFPFYMPQSLFYFLPRAGVEMRAHVFGNTAAFLLLAGVVTGMGLWLLPAQISPSVSELSTTHASVPVFLALWVMASLFDTAAVADGRANLQALAGIALSLVRAVALATVAILVGDLVSLLIVMIVVAAIKFALALVYGVCYPSAKMPQFDLALMRRQIVYAAPFAVGNAFFLLRGQADQWVVASLFSPSVFALISIAAVVLALGNLVTTPIRNALLPPLGRLLAADDRLKASELIAHGSAAIIMLQLPFLAWLFACAPDLVSLVYTDAYRDAGDLMRLYVAGMAASVIGGGYLLAAVDAGRSAVIISATNLLLSVTLSWMGAKAFGLQGAIAGGVVSLVVGELWALTIIGHKLRCSIWALCKPRLAGRVYGVVACAVAAAVSANAWLANEATVPRIVTGSVAFFGAFVALGYALHLHDSARDLISRLRAPLPE